MPNLYCDLKTFKSRLNITGSSDDPLLLALLENAGRAIDQLTDRFFFVKQETRYFDGTRSPLLLDQDLLSLTSLSTDDDGSGSSWETAWAAGDFELLPYSDEPKHAIAVTPWGTKSGFNPGQMKVIEVVGLWGFRNETADTGADLNEASGLSASDVTVTVTDGAAFSPGQTLLVDAEQLFVEAVSGDDVTVTRGVNGTTAATHSDGADVSVHRYPRPIVEACVIHASRLWKRKDSAFGGAAGATGAGRRRVELGVDPDVEALLMAFRRIPLAAV